MHISAYFLFSSFNELFNYIFCKLQDRAIQVLYPKITGVEIFKKLEHSLTPPHNLSQRDAEHGTNKDVIYYQIILKKLCVFLMQHLILRKQPQSIYIKQFQNKD